MPSVLFLIDLTDIGTHYFLTDLKGCNSDVVGGLVLNVIFFYVHLPRHCLDVFFLSDFLQLLVAFDYVVYQLLKIAFLFVVFLSHNFDLLFNLFGVFPHLSQPL